ncbi:hypothetical protein LXA43DRAFT_1187093 [Ganoderma leucocontextum]|nr:hypothetical protein LXA43DRAFT_1187093 [Ganoderma leucocontextum]
MNPSTHFPDPSMVPTQSYISTGESYGDDNSPYASPGCTSSPGVCHQDAWGQYVETYLGPGNEYPYAHAATQSAYTTSPFHATEPYSYNAQYAAGQQASTHTAPMAHGVSLSSAFRHTLPEASMSNVSPTLIHPLGHGEYPVPLDNGSTSRATYLDAPPSSSQGTFPQSSPDLVPYTRRNTPAPSTDMTPSTSAMQANNWQCPYCPYVQQSHRSPDLKRHIETHTRGAGVALWVCCGVPAVAARELGVPAEVVRGAPIFDFEGVPMVGGCRKTFSRRDALARHLRMAKGKGQCYGDPLSMYQPGNRLTVEES